MRKAIQIVLRQCMGLNKKDSVLIVTDTIKKRIAKHFFHEAIKLAKNALLVTTPVGKIDGEEPPKHIARVMKKGYDVLLLITNVSLSHTKATTAARKIGSRVASMPGITEDMINRCIPVDYQKIAFLNKKILKLLKKANQVRITTSKGTDFTIVVKGRKFFDDDNGIYTKPGSIGNLPSGELAFAPLEDKSNGIFIVDASMIEKKLKKPITIKVKNNYAYEITGGEEARQLLKMIKPLGKSAFNIAELGIGTNPKAKITGNILEDEKVIGTCHIALGNSSAIGGRIYAKCHLDGVIRAPTIFVDGKKIMEAGRLL